MAKMSSGKIKLKEERTKNAITYHGIVGKNAAAAVTVLMDPKTETTPIQEDSDKNQKFANWFDPDNLHPKKIDDAIAKDPEIPALIERYVHLLYSGGIRYGRWKMDGNKKVFELLDDEEINTWLEDSNINHYLIEAGLDAKYFSNAWAELKYDAKGPGSGKLYLSVQDASFCRFGKQNKNGLKDKTFVSANWNEDTSGKDAKPYPTLNPYFQPAAQVEMLKQNVTYYPLIIPGRPGSIYYQKTSWQGLIDGSILELSKLIIEFKKNYLTNGMTLKYHVEVDEAYFAGKYKDKWKNGKLEDRKKIIEDELTQFNDIMHGISKTGKTLLTMMKSDARLQQFSTWKINVLKPETVSNEYTNDMNQNSLIKCRAIGIDPSLVGSISGSTGSMGAGSGSDARVGFNIHSIANKPIQDIILSPINTVVKHINGWAKRYPGLTFITESYFIATQDEVSPDKRI